MYRLAASNPRHPSAKSRALLPLSGTGTGGGNPADATAAERKAVMIASTRAAMLGRCCVDRIIAMQLLAGLKPISLDLTMSCKTFSTNWLSPWIHASIWTSCVI